MGFFFANHWQSGANTCFRIVSWRVVAGRRRSAEILVQRFFRWRNLTQRLSQKHVCITWLLAATELGSQTFEPNQQVFIFATWHCTSVLRQPMALLAMHAALWIQIHFFRLGLLHTRKHTVPGVWWCQSQALEIAVRPGEIYGSCADTLHYWTARGPSSMGEFPPGNPMRNAAEKYHAVWSVWPVCFFRAH